ncbi:isochorismate synthase [Aequorivita sediminis]|uniref:isochorismate synthase n=1 Tax=Aequorivita sediminis TaxID=3073653 RepID=UPI0028B14823|nr:isochorismate synthase [Aequorivita sp. F6058]
MDFNILSDKISNHYLKKLPFVIYSKPNSNKLSTLLQKNDFLYKIEDLNQSGFILSPFNYQNSCCFIPERESEIYVSDFFKKTFTAEATSVSYEEDEEASYIKLLEDTIEAIKNDLASKIVISRPKNLKLQSFSIDKLLKRLFSAYPTAFRYIWYHPRTGLWCGATPETLVSLDNAIFTTMALAGTQAYISDESVTWRPKELDEQQQVTNMILDKLKPVTSSLEVSKTYTHRAGSLLHLRTDITGKLNDNTTLTTVASALHPTPAVGGNPKEIAQKFILENEGYNREFYTGFFGPVFNNGTSANLMVNLRCMKIEDDVARIFVGGGITLESNPKEEWQETQNKMQTMLQVLQPML